MLRPTTPFGTAEPPPLTEDQVALLGALLSVGLDELGELAEKREPALRSRQLAEALSSLRQVAAVEGSTLERAMAALRSYEAAWCRARIVPHAYARSLAFILAGETTPIMGVPR